MGFSQTCVTVALVVATLLDGSHGHSTLTWPPNRAGGTIAHAGACVNNSCMWYTDFTEIPGEPTVNQAQFRTFNLNVSSGYGDWSRKNPWRAPGSAPVYGSGCGLLGGAEIPFLTSAGNLVGGYPAGTDGANTTEGTPIEWSKGSVQEVAHASTANHGGGYSYRLCPKSNAISEACFQQHVLPFANDFHDIRYGDIAQRGVPMKMTSFRIPLVKVSQGTHPEGSEWARNPIPSCLMFDQVRCQGLPKNKFVSCGQDASGYGVVQCPPGMTQFPEPLPSISGHVPFWVSNFGELPQWSNSVAGYGSMISMGFPFNIVDQVTIPEGLDEGEYLLSFRLDAEQSAQVWQNCADIRIVDKTSTQSGEDIGPIFP